MPELPAIPARRRGGFNRAAPFRERLSHPPPPVPPPTRFNRAAPFRERLSGTRLEGRNGVCTLQSCRPLSGAVMGCGPAHYNRQGKSASIVPPPFGSGYASPSDLDVEVLLGASIVPPPFGSGYAATPCQLVNTIPPLQSCRPLSGAVIGGVCVIRRRTSRFNRAAPFRERLSASLLPYSCAAHSASIVPPPFGSGYTARSSSLDAHLAASIVPPPFGSGYLPVLAQVGVADDGLQSCRPLSGAVISASSPCCPSRG